MQKVAIITCFSYVGNKKYVFNPEYLRSDLRRIVSFSHQKIGCHFDHIHVLTDLQPSERIRQEILNDFQALVQVELQALRPLLTKALQSSRKYEQRPLDWLRSMTRVVEPRRPDELYRRLLRRILPVLRSTSVVEFASLFTNLVPISGEAEYRRAITSILKQPMTHLFFYYTGHGVRGWTSDGRPSVCLIVPKSGEVDFQSREVVQSLFRQILRRVAALIVFDCCHAESMIDLPYKTSFVGRPIQQGSRQPFQNDVLYLSSTLHDQTCGFYTLGREYGSLYTYYLIRFLESLSRPVELSQLRSEVEDKVGRYRQRHMKPPQNMLIGLSDRRIDRLPTWLFEGVR